MLQAEGMLPLLKHIAMTLHKISHVYTCIGNDQACFVAHSLGTTALSWMLHHPIGNNQLMEQIYVKAQYKTYVLIARMHTYTYTRTYIIYTHTYIHISGKSKVASTLLIDPVTFLLCDPTVATSFVYKDPDTAINFLMHFFLSTELFIANALSR